MNFEFCIKCGQKQTFLSSRPKFCSSCGSSFNSEPVDSSGETTERGVSLASLDVNKLRSSIRYDVSKAKVSLDDLWSNPLSNNDIIKRAKPRLSSAQDVLADSMKECAPVRNAKEVNE